MVKGPTSSGPIPNSSGMVNSFGMLNSSGYTDPSYAEQFQDHEDHADGNGGVGDVERPEVPAIAVNIDEIEDVAGADAIDQVAGSATDHEREAEPGQHLVTFEGRGIDGQAGKRRDGDGREQDRLEREVHLVE